MIKIAEKHKVLIVSKNGHSSSLSAALSSYFEICKIDLEDKKSILEKDLSPQILVLTIDKIEHIGAFLNFKDQHVLDHFSVLWYPEKEVVQDAELLWCYENGIRYVSGNRESGLQLLLAKIKGEIRTNRLVAAYHKRKLLFGETSGVAKDEDVQFMDKVYEYLSANLLTKDFCIEKLGTDLGMSRTHFFSKVKVITGVSPSRLVMNYRLGKAASLLEDKIGNITDVAYRVGFSSTAYFAKCFKEQFGKKPSVYLDEIRSKSNTLKYIPNQPSLDNLLLS